MQIVIDIPEEEYRKVQDGRASVSMMQKAIRNGTPLPKGHGRLIDADRLMRVDHIILESTVNNAPTIIEADKAESEG